MFNQLRINPKVKYEGTSKGTVQTLGGETRLAISSTTQHTTTAMQRSGGESLMSFRRATVGRTTSRTSNHCTGAHGIDTDGTLVALPVTMPARIVGGTTT